MNTRIQVEHPVTELVFGVDLVREQLRIAQGLPMAVPSTYLHPRGWAIECRITSEDPATGFLPSTGRITALRVPGGPGVRWDSGVEVGNEVTLYYDSLLAKLIVWAPNRADAIARMGRALDELLIAGVATNQSFHRRLMADDAFREGQFDIQLLERRPDLLAASADGDLVADLAVAIAVAEDEARESRAPAAADVATQRSAWLDAARRDQRPLTRGAAPDDGAVESVRIERIAAGGDGIGHLQDGRAVFVPRSAPGDLLELAQVTRQRSFARARIGRIVEPGPGRVAPRCPHYERDRCGGCQLQHLGPEAQRQARRAIVGDALRRVGRLEVADPSLEPAASDWGYRARITLHQSRRWSSHRLPPTWSAGRDLRPRDLSHHGTVGAGAVECRAPVAPVAPGPVRLPDAPARARWGPARHGAWRDPAWPDARRLVDTLRARLPNVTVWWQPPEGAARVVGESVAFPATVFEQVNPSMGDRVRAWAVNALGDVRDQAGWDLYAGIGETSRMLLERGARVESVESDVEGGSSRRVERGDGVTCVRTPRRWRMSSTRCDRPIS